MSEKIAFLINQASEEKKHDVVLSIAADNIEYLAENELNIAIRSAYELKNFDIALDFSTHAHRKYPSNRIFHLFIARCHNKLGNKNQSMSAYEDLMLLEPSLKEPFLMIARSKYADSDYRGAIDVLNGLNDISDEDTSILTLKARCFQNLERYEEAHSAWLELTDIEPQNVEAWSRLGQIDYNHRRFEDAKRRLEKALSIDPDYRIASRLIGLCYDALGETKIASDWLLKEAISHPRMYSNWLKVVDVMLKEGDEKAARDLIRNMPSYVDIEIESLWFSFLLSKSIGWSGYYEKIWTKILDISLHDPTNANFIGERLIDQGEIRLAVDLCDHLRESGLETTKIFSEITKISKKLGYDIDEVREKKNLVVSEMGIRKIIHQSNRIKLKKPTNHPISVLHISSSLGQGGAERQLLALAKSQLQDSRFSKVMILTYANQDPEKTYLEEAKSAGIELYFYSDPLNYTNEFSNSRITIQDSLLEHLPDRLVRDLGPMTRAIDTLKPGVVHTWQDGTNIIGGIASKLAGMPAVVMSCRSMRPDGKTMLHIRNRPYLLTGYKTLLEDPRFRVVVNSQAGAGSYTDWIGITKNDIRMIRNGYDFNSFKPEKPEIVSDYLVKNGVPDDADIVGGVFRFVPEKRVELWIEVAKQVISENDNVYFIAVGHGQGLSEAMGAVKNNGLEDKILFPGRTKDVPSWLQAFDAFLLTSRIEGLPNVLIEAQSHGVPVVSTIAGGSPETFVDGRTGFLSENDDSKSIAEAVKLILQDRNWRSIAKEESSDFVKNNFSIEKMADEYFSIYSDLMRESLERWMSGRSIMDRLLFRR